MVTWDKFCDKFNNYILKDFRHAEDVVCIVTDTQDQTMYFEARHMPKYLREDKKNRPSKHKMW